jgi:hypothetical protein
MKKSAATRPTVKFSIDVSLEGEGGFSVVRIEADSATERAEAHEVLSELAYPMDTLECAIKDLARKRSPRDTGVFMVEVRSGYLYAKRNELGQVVTTAFTVAAAVMTRKCAQQLVAELRQVGWNEAKITPSASAEPEHAIDDIAEVWPDASFNQKVQ